MSHCILSDRAGPVIGPSISRMTLKPVLMVPNKALYRTTYVSYPIKLYCLHCICC